MQLLNIIDEFPETLQTPVLHLVTALREERGVSHEDFSELKGVVQELAEAQKELTAAQQRTESRLEELAEAQNRTESRLEELAEAQKELAAAQNRTEKRVEELAEAQNRTQERVGELAEAMTALADAQQCIIQNMDRGFKKMDDKISALGSRWGLQNETTVRNLLQGVLGKTEYSVQRGYYGNREVDIIIRGDDTHILLEVTSALKASDIPKYIASADDYEAQTGVAPVIMVAAPHVPLTALKAILNASRPIELYSDDEEEEN